MPRGPVAGVVGAGTMGNGIAQVFAQSGFEVRLCDQVPAALDRAKAGIEKSLAKFVEKGKLTAADRDDWYESRPPGKEGDDQRRSKAGGAGTHHHQHLAHRSRSG